MARLIKESPECCAKDSESPESEFDGLSQEQKNDKFSELEGTLKDQFRKLDKKVGIANKRLSEVLQLVDRRNINSNNLNAMMFEVSNMNNLLNSVDSITKQLGGSI